MKKFKNFWTAFVSIAALFIFAVIPVTAQTQNDSLDTQPELQPLTQTPSQDLLRFLPDSTDFVFNFDATQESIFKEAWLYLLKTRLHSSTSYTDDGIINPDNTSTVTEKKQLMLDQIFSQGVTMALDVDSNEQPKLLIFADIAEDESDTFISLFGENKPQNYKNITYYNFEEAYIAYVEDTAVVSNDKDYLFAFLDNLSGEAGSLMLEESTFNFMQEQKLENSFLHVFFQPEFIKYLQSSSSLSDIEGLIRNYESVSLDLLQAINVEGLSMAQTDDGFDFSLYNETDLDYLTTQNLLPEKYEFTPSLYRYLSGEGLILYTEQKDLAEYFKDQEKMYDGEEGVFYHLEEGLATFGLEPDQDVMPLLTGQSLLAFHQQDSMIPAVTLIADINNMRPEAAQLLAQTSQKLRDYWNEMEESQDVDMYSYAVTSVGQNTFYTHTFDFSSVIGVDESKSALAQSYTTITLRLGITSDGLLLVSTSDNLGQLFHHPDDGLLSNADLKEVFMQKDDTVTGVAYLNIKALAHYFVALEQKQNELFDQNISTISEIFAAPLEAWKDALLVSYAHDNQSWTDGKVRVDTAKLNFPTSFLTEIFGLNKYECEDCGFFDSQEETIDTPAVSSFNDVNETDWFYPYIQSLDVMGVVEGRTDSTFNPHDPITRAEFAKIVIEAFGAAQKLNLNSTSEENAPFWFKHGEPKTFTDVNDVLWHQVIADRASSLGMMQGYDDNTFRPDMPITRAEAAQILYNLDEDLADYFAKGEEPFGDVGEGDWFYQAVRSLYNGKFIQGVSANSFEPHRYLTRAEAAKLVVLAMLEKQHHMGELNFAVPVSYQIEDYEKNVSESGFISVQYLQYEEPQKACEYQKDLFERYGLFIPDIETPEPQVTPTTWYQTYNSDRTQITLSCHQPAGLEGDDPNSNAGVSIVEITQQLHNRPLNNTTMAYPHAGNKFDIPVPKGAQDVYTTQALLTYKLDTTPRAACEAQALLVKETGWQPSSTSSEPVIADEAWAQVFEKGDLMLTLACAKNPQETEFTVIIIRQTESFRKD